jgi:small conductance mechanosensitive channel
MLRRRTAMTTSDPRHSTGSGARRPGQPRRGAGGRGRTATSRRPPARRAPRPGTAAARRAAGGAGARLDYRRAARARLRRFRSGSALAVALTGILLLLWGSGSLPAQQAGGVPPAPPAMDTAPAGAATTAPITPDTVAAEAARSIEEARSTVRELIFGFTSALPKAAVAILVLFLAALLAAVLKPALRRVLGSWARGDAMAALAAVLLWLLAIGVALSILAGDARALIGSVGLFGLALSWALQAPIESFSGWLLNSFRGYYRVGDRIEVGEVFGDVFRIDFLTTTVWEAGGPGSRVAGAQATGSLITFPNSEVLRANIVNFTRDFPFLWDEVTVTLAVESDLDYALDVLGRAARAEIGNEMAEPARVYAELLQRRGLDGEVSEKPQLFVSNAESWVDVTVRYLVPARARRVWRHRMTLALHRAAADPVHGDRMLPGFPRTEFRTVPGPGT